MLPRLKLIQCFQCENNLECWGLLEDIPLGKNDRDFYIDHEKFIAEINKFPQNGEMNIAEYYGMISALFMQALRFDKKVNKRDVYQLINVLGACCNVDDYSWICPGEEPDDEKEFVFVPRG